MEKRGGAQGNPQPGRRGWGAAGGAQGAAGRLCPGARSQPATPPGWGWKEDQPSSPATTFQVAGDCRRGREERGAGFVCLAPSYAFQQITENAAEGSSRAEFGTDKSRGRLSPISDASHVFVFPFPILAVPINHPGSAVGLSLPRAKGPGRRRGADAPVHGDTEPARDRCCVAGSRPAPAPALPVNGWGFVSGARYWENRRFLYGNGESAWDYYPHHPPPPTGARLR